MTPESSLPGIKLTPHVLLEKVRSHGWSWSTGGAICGLCLGIISPIVGSAFTVLAWFTGPHWHGFPIQRYGTVLLFLTIPLLLFGGHCLDLMDQHNHKTSKSSADDSEVQTSDKGTK